MFIQLDYFLNKSGCVCVLVTGHCNFASLYSVILLCRYIKSCITCSHIYIESHELTALKPPELEHLRLSLSSNRIFSCTRLALIRCLCTWWPFAYFFPQRNCWNCGTWISLTQNNIKCPLLNRRTTKWHRNQEEQQIEKLLRKMRPL